MINEASFPPESRLGSRIASLIGGLRESDGVPISPQEERDVFAVIALVAAEGGPKGADPLPSEDAARLKALIAPILVRNAEEMALFNHRFVGLFEGWPRTDRTDVDDAVPSDDLGSAGAWGWRRVNLRGLLPVAGAAAILMVIVLAYPMLRNYWLSGQTQLIAGTSGRPREPSSQPNAAPAEASAWQLLSPDELLEIARRMVAAAGSGRRANLYEIAAGWAGGANAADVYEQLILATGLPQEERLNVADPVILARLTAAGAFLSKPGHRVRADDLDAAVKRAWLAAAASTVAPIVRPPLAAGARVMPWWALWAIGGLAASPAVIWLARRWKRKRAFLKQALERRRALEVRRLEVKDNVVCELAEASRTLNAAARYFLARVSIGPDALDTARTVAQSAGRGGRFTPVYSRRRARPEYLFLVTTSGPNDHQAERMSWLVEQLTALEVPLETYFIEHDSDRVFRSRGEARIRLRDLYTRYPDYRLIVLGSGDGFLNPGSLEPRSWARDVRQWTSRALVTPVPTVEWSQREVTLAAVFGGPLHQASPKGLAMLAERLGRDEAGEEIFTGDAPDAPVRSWRFDPKRWLINLPPDEDREWAALDAEVSAYLDGAGREWLQAAAVYPALRWDLTLYLGLKMISSGTLAGGRRPLYSEERAVRLCLLPWFRTGRMPAWIRRRLIAEIDPPRRVAISRLIGELLVSAVDPQPGRTVIRLPIATASSAAGGGPRPQRRDGAAEDAVLLDFLETEDASAFEPPRRFVERFLNLDAFKALEWRSGLLPFAYGAAALWLVPKPWNGPLALGAWWPLAILSLGALTWPLARRLGRTREGGGR